LKSSNFVIKLSKINRDEELFPNQNTLCSQKARERERERERERGVSHYKELADVV
jgi:hypothetical protein